jgi:hypothetical protein
MTAITEKLRPTRGRQIPPERLQWAKRKLGTWTSLTVDFAALTDDEARDLLALVGKASATDDETIDKFDADLLSKRDRARLEKLVEVGAHAEPGTFRAERERQSLRAEVQKIARDALKFTPTREQQALFFVEVIRQVHDDEGPCLHAEHIGVLTLTLASMFGGEMPRGALNSRVERGDDGHAVIVWEKHYPLFGPVDGELDGRMFETISHLEANGWLSLSGRQQVRIALGPRALRVFGKARR